MLNPFPIQFLAPLAYMLLRFCIGVILIRFGTTRIKNRNPTMTLGVPHSESSASFALLCIGLLETTSGILLILGLYTQFASLVALILSGAQILFSKRFITNDTPPRIFFFLLFFASLSLFITGAGAFAIDLPV